MFNPQGTVLGQVGLALQVKNLNESGEKPVEKSAYLYPEIQLWLQWLLGFLD